MFFIIHHTSSCLLNILCSLLGYKLHIENQNIESLYTHIQRINYLIHLFILLNNIKEINVRIVDTVLLHIFPSFL